MKESSEIILLRFFEEEQELDVFRNGDKVQTFYCSAYLPLKIAEMLEGLGYKSFEKQHYLKRIKGD